MQPFITFIQFSPASFYIFCLCWNTVFTTLYMYTQPVHFLWSER